MEAGYLKWWFTGGQPGNPPKGHFSGGHQRTRAFLLPFPSKNSGKNSVSAQSLKTHRWLGPNPSVIGDFVRGFDGSERIFKIDVQHGACRVALVKCQWPWTTRSVRGLDPGCSPLKEGKPQSHVGFLWGQCSQGDHEADAWLMVICSHTIPFSGSRLLLTSYTISDKEG